MVGRSFCAGHYTRQEQHHPHKFHHQFVSSSSSPTARQSQLQDLNIAPRKLLSLRAAAAAHSPNSSSELMPDSPDEVAALMQKFLPYNGEGRGRSEGIKDDGFDPDPDPYSSDQFRMFEFKIRRCTRSRSHDWTDCPFSHPGEKAKRRDPRKYHYSGTVCPESRRCGCPKGDDCEFAHGVFECWLHPSRYRTEACKDGKNCKRKVCFFAHSPRELRVLPPQDDGNYEVAAGTNKDQQQKYCCKCCSLSPTSTLMGTSHFSSSPPMSPTLSSSPPISPTMRGRGGLAAGGFSRSSLSSPCATSRYSDWMSGSGGDHVGLLSYEDIIMNEIVNSLGKNMSLSRRHRDEFMAAAGCGFEGTSPNGNMSVNQKTRPWVDVNFAGVNGSAAGYGVGDGDERYQQQQQFVLSPSPTICTDQSPIHDSSVGIHKIFFSASTSSASSTPVRTDSCSSVDNYVYGFAEDKANMDPDLGWVNDLLM